MKKTFGSLAVFVSIVGVLAAFAATASAETRLCKTQPGTHKCNTSDTYALGTTIKGKLTSTTINIRSPEDKEKWFDSCTGSEFEGSIVKSMLPIPVQVNLAKFTFTGCTEPNTTARLWPNTTVPDFITRSSGDNGIWHSGSMIKFGLGYVYGAPAYECQYQMPEGELVGGSTPSLVYNGGYAHPHGGAEENFVFCPKEVRIFGTYSLTPAPLYVEES